MDTQTPSPNIPAGGERPAVNGTENLPNVAETPISAENVPVPAVGATPPPKLTAADVAAALAATTAAPSQPTAIVPAAPANLTAGDVDVIEPEWVAKAESVVQAHAGDPYGEEEAIQDLQEEYLQKRYGINVADPNAGESKTKGA
jgi:hypothetical protein